MVHTMFLAVFAVTLFMLSAAIGGSAADSCTASLPLLVGGGGECSALEGGELVNGIRQNVSIYIVARSGTLYATRPYFSVPS